MGPAATSVVSSSTPAGEGAAGQFKVVHGREHRPALAFPGAEDVRQLLGREEVEAGEWFVEEKDVRALGEGAGEENPLLLAAREHPDLAVGEGGEAEFLQGSVHQFAVGGPQALEKFQGRITALFDHTAHGRGEIPVDGVPLGQVGEARQKVLGMGVTEEDFACGLTVPAEDGLEEGALAGAVGAEDRRRAAAGEIHGDIFQRRLPVTGPAVRDGDLAKREDVGRAQRGGLNWIVGMGRGPAGERRRGARGGGQIGELDDLAADELPAGAPGGEESAPPGPENRQRGESPVDRSAASRIPAPQVRARIRTTMIRSAAALGGGGDAQAGAVGEAGLQAVHARDPAEEIVMVAHQERRDAHPRAERCRVLDRRYMP